MQPLDEPIALWPPNLGGAMLDLFELKEQFIRMLVLTSAEFLAIVAEHRADLGVVSLEEGSTSLLSTWTAVTGNLLVYRRS